MVFRTEGGEISQAVGSRKTQGEKGGTNKPSVMRKATR
jgi:hypothetical protein